MCRVNDIEGNTLIAVSLTHDGSKLKLTTLLGNELTLPHEAVASLDFNLGRLTYLSNLPTHKVFEKSAIGLVQPFRRDTNLDGEPIYLDKAYTKGLSMHAYSELEFFLGGNFRELRGVLGVDIAHRRGESA